jgi:Protein of unknown function (DUF4058)
MPSPFPGMDPYLERPRWFRGFHNKLITYIEEALQPLLPPPYFALMGELIWMEASERYVDPDVDVLRRPPTRAHQAIEGGEEGGVATLVDEDIEEPVVVSATEKRKGEERTEPYLEIYARREGEDRLVTSIEILSLTNKRLGSEGRLKYLEKQREILDGDVNLVEIDLLRGAHTSAVPHGLAREKAGPFDYHVSIHRFDRTWEFLVYPIALSRRLPTIRIPLLPGDAEVPLNLQSVFQRTYDAGPYRRAVRYGEDPIDPPLPPAQATWASEVLAKASAPSPNS